MSGVPFPGIYGGTISNHEKMYYSNQTIGRKIKLGDYFDKQAQAIDMNRNKAMFEMYFNLQSKVISRDQDPDDIKDIPADGDYVEIARYLEALFK